VSGLTFTGAVAALPAASPTSIAPQNTSRTQPSVAPTAESEGLAAQADDDTQRIQATNLSGPPGATAASSTSGSSDASQPLAQLAAATAPPTPIPSTPDCDRSVSPFYCVYTVKEGDRLDSIAYRFGLKGTEDIERWRLISQSNNDVVTDPNEITPGLKLRIPVGNAVIHEVLTTQTLSEIADQYDVKTETLVQVNNLADPNALQRGQVLLVPEPKRYSKPAPAPPASSASAPAPQIIRGSQQSRSGFIWPTTGPISSQFGPSHPRGIDIDLHANPNAPIGAAAAGRVVFAGGNTCCSFGLYVIVDHGNGIETLYAHLSAIHVSVGMNVVQGQVLGLGGRTGYATGNHLHFEVHVNGAIVNPLAYLP
jgi:murein DD-endopeptidase MepM/ murein hydrolase activator NlpD